MIGRPGTLTRQLVTRTAALVAAVALALSALITLTVWHILSDKLDGQLMAATALQLQDRQRGDGGRPRGVTRPGMPPGTLVIQQVDENEFIAGVVERGRARGLDSEAIATLLTLPADGAKRTVSLERHGRYRVVSVVRDGSQTVVALPLAELSSTIRTLLFAELVLGCAAVAASMVVSGALVRRTVRPLNRLAEAASEVSQLELHRGEVELPVRVDTSGLHPNDEVARVGNAFNHMLGNVEGALAARQASETKVRQFVADASHELRNPLAAIRGYSELSLRHAAGLPADTGHALARISAESIRMSKLVNDLLLLARLDSSPELACSPVDVTELVLNAVSDARASDSGHVWRLDLPDEPMLVSGEADKLHQALTNLLSNARIHTPAGTTVTASVRRDGETITIRVIDDGPGIPPEDQQKVFGRFARGDAMRTHSAAESTGLGLAIVAAIAAAHGGRVGLASRPGHTEFSLTLPALRPQ
ncbi:MAG: HAMP domain-containing sensor histidine kinase [Propionibacteriaceae bacterium]|nr:HAMP domain-containing sensor histidine kinase [Propionibacteriaceae bacterium]